MNIAREKQVRGEANTYHRTELQQAGQGTNNTNHHTPNALPKSLFTVPSEEQLIEN